MKKIIAVIAIVATAIAIATLILTQNNSVIPSKINNPSATPPVVTTTPPLPTQGKHYEIGLSEGIGIKENH